MTTQNPGTLKRLVLSRFYLSRAIEHGKSSREVDVFATVNLLQEAVETFLVAAAAHVNAPIGTREEFASYFDKIDRKISPLILPFRSKMIQLNKARNMAKHDSIVPDRSEVPGFMATVREFLEAASSLVFNIDFRVVSLIDALPDGQERDFLREAQIAFENNDYTNTLISCRKAIYIRHEKSYDVRQFIDGQPTSLASFFSKVPNFARNKEYITNIVKEPTDYIVLDHSKIDSELVKDGLDAHQFWNIWRLTPRVYLADNDRWIVRHEPSKVDSKTVAENASFVLENTVDHFIALARVRERQRMIGPSQWTVTTGPGGTRIFLKASETSEVAAIVPPGVNLNVDGATEGFEAGTTFWKVMSSHSTSGNWYFGYALQDELEFN